MAGGGGPLVQDADDLNDIVEVSVIQHVAPGAESATARKETQAGSADLGIISQGRDCSIEDRFVAVALLVPHRRQV